MQGPFKSKEGGNYLHVAVKKTAPSLWTKRGSQKSLGKNGRIQNYMLHFEMGIQIKQGWQFLHYCKNTILNFFPSSHSLFFHMFCMCTHIVKCFPRNFWLSLLIKDYTPTSFLGGVT